MRNNSSYLNLGENHKKKLTNAFQTSRLREAKCKHCLFCLGLVCSSKHLVKIKVSKVIQEKSGHSLQKSKQYQQCDIEDHEESFAGRTGEISPVEFEPSVVKMLKEGQPTVWIWIWSRGTGTEHHIEWNQNRQRKPHCSDCDMQSRVPNNPPGSNTQRRNLTL